MVALPPDDIVRGNPPSASYQPKPIDMVRWMQEVESRLAVTGNAVFWEDTLADLNAVSGAAEGDTGFVIADGTTSNRGVYRRGASSWAKTAALPAVFEAFTVSAADISEAADAKVMTAAERNKLAGVATGADVTTPANVQSSLESFTDTSAANLGSGDRVLMRVAGLADVFRWVSTLNVVKSSLSYLGSISEKVTLADADLIGISDSAAANEGKRATLANLWAYVQGKSDGRYVQQGADLDTLAETAGAKIMTADERIKLSSVETGADETTPANVQAALELSTESGLDNLGTGDLGLERVASLSGAFRWVSALNRFKASIALIPSLAQKATVVDADEVAISDSAGSAAAKRVSMASILAYVQGKGLFATAAQGAKADSAVQPEALGSAAAAAAADFATAAQGAKADSAVQSDVLARALAIPSDRAEARDRLTTATIGAPEGRAIFAGGTIEADADLGRVLVLGGSDIPGASLVLTPRQPVPVEAGRIYRATLAVKRLQEAADPLSATVNLRLRHLREDYSHFSVVDLQGSAPKLIDEVVTYSALVSTLAGYDRQIPAGVLYIDPEAEIFDDEAMRLAIGPLRIEDVTAEVQVAEAQAAIAALQDDVSPLTVAGLGLSLSEFEEGSTPDVTATWSTTGAVAVTGQEVKVGSAAYAPIGASDTAYVMQDVADTTTLIVRATNADGAQATASATVTRKRAIYWGTSDDPTAADSAEIVAFGGYDLDTQRARTVEFANPGGEFVCIAWPLNLGLPSSVETPLGPISYQTRVLQVTNASGLTQDYRLIWLDQRQFGASVTVIVE